MQAVTSNRVKRPRRARIGSALAGAAIIGLLIWAKLLLVTDYPRTAIATPESPLSTSLSR